MFGVGRGQGAGCNHYNNKITIVLRLSSPQKPDTYHVCPSVAVFLP